MMPQTAPTATATTTNPDHLPWGLAEAMIREFLPASVWAEDVLTIEKGEPGVLEVRSFDGRRTYVYHGCRLTVRRVRDGRDFDRVYTICFDWREGRWQLVDLPRVCATDVDFEAIA